MSHLCWSLWKHCGKTPTRMQGESNQWLFKTFLTKKDNGVQHVSLQLFVIIHQVVNQSQLFVPSVLQERLPEGDPNHVSSEGPQHCPPAGGVCWHRPPVYDHWVHGKWRPEPVPLQSQTKGGCWWRQDRTGRKTGEDYGQVGSYPHIKLQWLSGI